VIIVRLSCRLVALLSLLILAACASAPPPPPPKTSTIAAPAKPAPKPAPVAKPSEAAPAAAKPEPIKPAQPPALPLVAPVGAPQVALLLPLSGASATLGNAMLNAAQLALFELADSELTLLPLDSKGTAEGAVAAVQQAVASHVDIIIGPLFAAEARAAAPIAGAAHIPMLSLSADRSVAGRGTYVLGFLPGPQAVAMADYAAGKGRLRQAVLAPGNDYGRAVVADLKLAAAPLGITLAPVEYYDWLRRAVPAR
jgi:ABC-type branched-subunit amino acid transport system substrate-binding protein